VVPARPKSYASTFPLRGSYVWRRTYNFPVKWVAMSKVNEEAAALRAKAAQHRVGNDILLAVYYYRNSGQVAP
jgi:hypothetical protein